MGPSGAGKSSLLNILTGYITQGVKGKLSFGGNGHSNRKLCSYILQEDYLQPLFTVEEIMVMACDLKVSSNSLNRTEKHRLIDNILDTLHLSFCKQTRCGSLSGGQRKRLSIALELIDNPPILFLDEPTTGLDSSSSLYTIKLLQGLAREGRTIVCTIHQPSATVYEMFDHVYVLADGNCVYQGTALNTVPYLRSVGLHCPPYHNAADYLLEVTNKEYGNFTDSLAKAATDPSWRLVVPTVTVLPPPPPPTYDSNHNDAEYQGGHRIMEELEPMDAALPLTMETTGLPVKPGQPHRKTVRVCQTVDSDEARQHSAVSGLGKEIDPLGIRGITVTHLKLFVHIVCAIVIGLLFGDSGINATKSISNVASFLVHILYLWYTTLMPGVLKYPYEMNILKKESFNRWYKIRTYFVASMLTSLPVQIFFTIVYASIVYSMTSQPCELERYLMFTAVLVLNTIVADGFGLFLGTFLNEINGTFIGAIMTCFMFVFCGFFIMFSHMSEAMRGISYLSSHRYGFEALVLTAYDDNRADLVCPGDPTVTTRNRTR
ncbi:abc transporter [Anopheles darlingi]|uniref:Abc transporter n=1 Tax=Anopheles darlingi TaxID=43151 RepID=W5JN36_ANODA|nr:abc transporter [Anopheles darlingi]